MSTSLKAHSTILEVVRQANPKEDVRRQRVFAWAVTALLICGSALLSRWLTVMTGPAKATSKLRRLQRWLENPLVDVAAYYRPFIQAALSAWANQELLLIIDGTSPRGACVVCRISVCYRGRAFPLCWQTFDSRSHSIAYACYESLLKRACSLLPAGCRVTLLGDRGFGHRALMKWCRRAGWHYVLRLKADSIVLLPDGSRRRLDRWRPAPQSLGHLADVRLLGAGGEKIGPLHVYMTRAPEPAKEAWYLASDNPYGCEVLAQYRCRFHIEIVQSQLTKAGVRAVGRGRDHVANLDLVVGDDNAVYEHLDQDAALGEGGVGQSGTHLSAYSGENDRGFWRMVITREGWCWL